MPGSENKFTNSKKSTIFILCAVFLCYTAMYAVRKSFLAGQYTDLDLGYGLDAKTILVISQVLGYMVSKFIGIRVISEMKQEKRTLWLIGFITFGLAMLGLFAVVPPRLKVLALFFNGMPLGMVFGIVFSYIEGRKNTELLAAALSATFIFSTGLVKTVGLVLMKDFNVSEYNMPFLTGLLFFPVFILSALVLKKTKGPDERDIKERTQRVPMFRSDRKRFLIQNGLGYFGLVLIYILLTIMRDFRDNFIVEFWAEQGVSGVPQLVTLTEIPVAVVVLVVAAGGILVRNNQKAFGMGMVLIAAGALLAILSSYLFHRAVLSPVWWMILSGIGSYLPYILFHCLIFERLVALLGFRGNVGFLFYLADALGYLGTVIILFLKEIIGLKQSWTSFFVSLNIQCAALILVLVAFALWYFNRRISPKSRDMVLV
ncbi:DUF5690 family protein [Niabella beijingensis]|uniref:DUF5690 family protein n=1 Tax=Niabella beijingensis TaxID=2872700 RepID=UPI001CBB71FD|nr:DUF5690 family protein [Niabella beijingensis]MBZ4192387.1 DUF5690 family protein [Niabella beijingensis]